MAQPENTIALLGATGTVGTVFLKVALDAGWNVRALVRTPSKMATKSDKLTVIQGSFTDDMDKLEFCLTGADYVVNVAGALSGGGAYPKDLNLNLVKALRPIMAKVGTKVFLYNAGGFAFLEGETVPCMFKFIRCIAGCISKNLEQALQDHENVYKYMTTSGMIKNEPYGVIVTRPGAFGAGPSKGKVKVSAASGMGTASVDIAAFYLEAIKDKSLFGTFPYLNY